MDTKLPPFTTIVVSFGSLIIMLSEDKVPLFLIKGLTVFQKDLLDAEPSLVFHWKYVLSDFFSQIFIHKNDWLPVIVFDFSDCMFFKISETIFVNFEYESFVL